MESNSGIYEYELRLAVSHIIRYNEHSQSEYYGCAAGNKKMETFCDRPICFCNVKPIQLLEQSLRTDWPIDSMRVDYTDIANRFSGHRVFASLRNHPNLGDSPAPGTTAGRKRRLCSAMGDTRTLRFHIR